MSVIGRVDDGDSRWYIDPLNGAQYESVTRILSSTASKPWLQKWAAKLAAESAVAHLDLLRELVAAEGPGPAVVWLTGAAQRRREMKAEIGRYEHDVIEALILDAPIPTPPEYLVDVEIDGEYLDLDRIADGFLRFNEDFHPEYLMAEATVANPEHRYAGTLDLVARFPTLGNRVGVIDTKTGKVLDVQVGPQLAAYRRASEVWLNDLGDRARMPQADFAAVLHLRADYARGYKLLEQDAGDEAFDWFLTCRKVLAAVEGAQAPRGRPLYPARADGSQPPLLVEDCPAISRFDKALATVGATDIELVSLMTVAELIALSGIGEQSVHTILAALAERNLTLAGDLPCPGGQVSATRRVARKVVGDCPTCGQQVSASREGATKFHTAPMAVAA